jgi:hypothetical protein
MSQDQSQSDKNATEQKSAPVSPKTVFKPPFSNPFKNKPGNTGFNPARFKTQHKG